MVTMQQAGRPILGSWHIVANERVEECNNTITRECRKIDEHETAIKSAQRRIAACKTQIRNYKKGS